MYPIYRLPKKPTEDPTLKLKRQVRDHYNKKVHDVETIKRVALIIGYPKEA